MPENGMQPSAMNDRLATTPYGAWLGLQVLSLGGDGLKMEVPWRPEFVGTPGTRIVHGGILAAVIDTAGSYAIAAELGRPLPTIDLRVDYHRPIGAETMAVTARLIRLGRRLATAEVEIVDRQGRLAVTGRGLYALT